MLFDKKIAAASFPIPETLKFEDWWILFNACLIGGTIIGVKIPLIYYRTTGNNDNYHSDFKIRVLRDFRRHEDYYHLFLEKIADIDDFANLKKIIHWNICFRSLVLEKSFLKRLHKIRCLFDTYRGIKRFVLLSLALILGDRLLIILKFKAGTHGL